MDKDAIRKKIDRLNEGIRWRRLFLGGGFIAASTPFLPLLQQPDAGLELGWGSYFLIGVGLFAVLYAYLTNRHDQAEVEKLQAELDAEPAE